jgi:hypothetical protein
MKNKTPFPIFTSYSVVSIAVEHKIQYEGDLLYTGAK